MSLPCAYLIRASSSSTSTPFPPKPLVSPSLLPPIDQAVNKQEQNQLHHFQVKISRRDAIPLLFVALVPSLRQPGSAQAFSIGISGPKDWLRAQKKKSVKFLLAPIDASRNSLRTAYLLLLKGNSDNGDKGVEELQKLLKSAARDCVAEDRNSFVAFQAKTGVEVCTFRLVLKNASSLLDDSDPLKLEAEASLIDLIRSFTSLNAMANEIDILFPSSRQKVADALMDTISSLNKFEQEIKDCLEI
ncbi:hypothetical protein NMG60_11016278 [Bertholletia excelsa]